VPVEFNVVVRMKKRLEEVISREKLSKFLEESAKFVFAEARERAPVRTGKLRESISLIKVNDLHYVVGSPLEYAVYVERGTRPHIIRPKRARALRFVVGGETVFARLVRHPGTKPHPFFTHALQKYRTVWKRIWKSVMGGG
jgi:HK97 gp10 family phage protein